jgi:hypothetical protein
VSDPIGSSSLEPSRDTRLNGWKEIAAYFGKGVRTVQRWEKENGLPVRRIGSGRGEIVFAFVSELEAWARQWRPAIVEDEPSSLVGSPAVHPVGRPPVFSRRRVLSVGAMVLILLGAAVAGVAWLRPRGVPALHTIDVDTLIVFNADQHEVFRKKFDEPLNASVYSAGVRADRPLIRMTDFDDDGRREVLFARHGATAGDDSFVCFSSTGRVRFERKPDDIVRFGNAQYSAPWYLLWFTVLGPPGHRSLWVAWSQREFPSFIERLDVHGRREAQYWSNGFIESVALGTVAGRPSVLVGAASNDTLGIGDAARGASLAVLDTEFTRAVAPSLTEKYACATCEPNWPRAFMIFPPLEFARATLAIPTVRLVEQSATGQVTVMVDQGAAVPGGSEFNSMLVWYRFDSSMKLIGTDLQDGYAPLHAIFERARLIDHPFSRSEVSQMVPIRAWNGSTFEMIGLSQSAPIGPRLTPARARPDPSANDSPDE